MYIQQLYTSCLAEAAYYIESDREAVIIDPLRDPHPYLDLALQRGATIKYVLETHFHADFVSGHLELARKSGAQIVYGEGAKAAFDFLCLKDNEEIKVGNLTIRALHTPGHTLESTVYLLLDKNGKEHAIFSGDTLFIGDVGRPDLAVKSDMSEKDLAGMLFDSLRNKIKPLPDDVIVYPAHGQGSACGKNMSKERFDTLGNQKRLNYALDEKLTKDEFIEILTSGLNNTPQYFPKNVLLNQNGYSELEEVLSRGSKALDPDEFEKLSKIPDYLILDTRSTSDYASGSIPNSLFIGIDGGFAPWVGTLIEDLNTPILLLADEDRLEEVIQRLARVGYDNPQGYLRGGIKAWKDAGKPVEILEEVNAEYLEKEHLEGKIIDVRKPGEYENLHLLNVPSLPLDNIMENYINYDPEEKYFLHCAGGYRSVIAASILKQKGISKVVNVLGGFSAIRQTSLAMDVAPAVS